MSFRLFLWLFVSEGLHAQSHIVSGILQACHQFLRGQIPDHFCGIAHQQDACGSHGLAGDHTAGSNQTAVTQLSRARYPSMLCTLMYILLSISVELLNDDALKALIPVPHSGQTQQSPEAIADLLSGSINPYVAYDL